MNDPIKLMLLVSALSLLWGCHTRPTSDNTTARTPSGDSYETFIIDSVEYVINPDFPGEIERCNEDDGKVLMRRILQQPNWNSSIFYEGYGKITSDICVDRNGVVALARIDTFSGFERIREFEFYAKVFDYEFEAGEYDCLQCGEVTVRFERVD